MKDLPDSYYKAVQVSVFLENRAGRLAEVIHILAEEEINLRALSLADTSDFGILRIMVSDPAGAESALKRRGLTTGKTTVVALELEDIPGALDAVLQLLSANGINVEYMYAFARRDVSRAVMIFRFDKIDEAIAVLKNSGFALIPVKELDKF